MRLFYLVFFTGFGCGLCRTRFITSIDEQHAHITKLAVAGDFKQAAALIEAALTSGVRFGNRLPNIHTMLGVALYNMNRYIVSKLLCLARVLTCFIPFLFAVA